MVYKGKKRCFGEFKCIKCNRYWRSAYSWADTAQKCRSCNIYTKPFQQSPLLKPKGQKGSKNKHHPQELCGKCTKLGYFCGTA